MATKPSSQFHAQLLPASLLLLLVILAGAAEEGCHHKCGDMDIPFPFGIGIGPGCFRRGFEVLCNDSYDPPRAFLPRKQIYGTAVHTRLPGRKYQNMWLPLELISITVATSELQTYAPVSFHCSTDDNGSYISEHHGMDLSRSLFAVSAARNVLIGLGANVETLVLHEPRFGSASNRLSCRSQVYLPTPNARNGSCRGRGCCEELLPPDDFLGREFGLKVEGERYKRGLEEAYPCSYGMLVEKSWYNFSTLDMRGDRELLKRYPRGVPLVLQFNVGNGLCPTEGPTPRKPDYACVSDNSFCVNTTYTVENTYICKCSDHYAGNPYIPNGCQDIDECKLPAQYNCTSDGICENRLGGYDCPCKFGMKGDGKAGTCTDIFPLAAKASVGAIGGILLMAVLSFIVIIHKEKKKTEEFYKKNGGPTLEKANGIKLFRKGELMPILKNSNLIGKGCFGEVYKGLLDNKEVAIKKPINGSVLENEQFANEVIIQSQVIHKNIVRLIGCCLEVDAPMLVYEFISQGSLHDILHNNNNKVALYLDARLSIAAQSADGLAYMHSQANTRILHGDVKPANILLDENFVPKISDFGISRLLARDKEHTGSVIGDMNYMDPVYLQEGLLTEKSDVYSFGVVILELISSRRAIHSENNSLVKIFLEAHKKQKKVTEFFDKEIVIAEDLELLDSLAGMAVECLILDVDQRQMMMEIAERLHKLSRSRKVQDVCH
ncbi:hypothetical protein ACQJBY_011553 [Aegilops geniculata]